VRRGRRYAACHTTESLTDTLSIDLAILLGTSRIQVGSFVTLSYLRHLAFISAFHCSAMSSAVRCRFSPAATNQTWTSGR